MIIATSNHFDTLTTGNEKSKVVTCIFVVYG